MKGLIPLPHLFPDPPAQPFAPAQDWWTRAIEHHRAGEIPAAIQAYQRHLDARPDDVDGWLALASVLRRSAGTDAALVCCQRALRIAPHSAAVWSNLGNLWLQLDDHEQSLRCHHNALAADAQQPRLRLDYARALRAARRYAQAETLIGECLAAEPERADLLLERALIRLHCGNHAAAWQDFEARLRLRPVPVPEVPLPWWQGERLAGKRLLLLAEGGIAATLWATRFIPLLARRGVQLTLACPETLHPVLQDLPLRLVAEGTAPGLAREHDLQCALLSLPGLLSTRGLMLPEPAPLSAPQDALSRFAARFGGNSPLLRIGIAGADDDGSDGAAHGVPPMRRLLALAAVPFVEVFVLGGRPPPDAPPAAARGTQVQDVRGTRWHLGDVAAAIAHMDLIVAADGTVARLAAAMPRPAVALLPYDAHWIYGDGGDLSPWYPTLRLLRQREPGDWSPVFRELQHLVMRWADFRARNTRDARDAAIEQALPQTPLRQVRRLV